MFHFNSYERKILKTGLSVFFVLMYFWTVFIWTVSKKCTKIVSVGSFQIFYRKCRIPIDYCPRVQSWHTLSCQAFRDSFIQHFGAIFSGMVELKSFMAIHFLVLSIQLPSKSFFGCLLNYFYNLSRVGSFLFCLKPSCDQNYRSWWPMIHKWFQITDFYLSRLIG